MKTRLKAGLVGLALAVVLPAAALGNDTCIALLEISYPGEPPVSAIGTWSG